MTILKTGLTVILVLTAVGLAAAETLTTPGFPSGSLISGDASCAVTNGSNKTTTTATVIMFDFDGTALSTDGPFTLAPGATSNGSFITIGTLLPASCRCVVPDKNHKCSFMFVDGSHVTVIPGN